MKYTTIQLTPKTKELIRRRGRMGESYEGIILRLLKGK
jgi:hypothetical protein